MGLDVGNTYDPTEEERRVFKECNRESFMYRSVPYSLVSMFVTQALIARGTLTASRPFGSLPKVVFAGLCGYLFGKISYMETCREKFNKLENSPLGEALRQRALQGSQWEKTSDPNTRPFDHGPIESSSHRSVDRSEEPLLQRGRDTSPPIQSHREGDEGSRKKAVLYEDLRTKNRENYEDKGKGKPGTVVKGAPAETEPDKRLPKKEVKKKNIYGDDIWEE